MKHARLLDRPEDFVRLGVRRDVVEPWEDGQRDDDRTGTFEWWYFDAMMEDGSKVVVNFNTKIQFSGYEKGSPRIARIRITPPDGSTHFEDVFIVPAADTELSSKGCNVRFGNHHFAGDLQEYEIKIAPVNGIGADLRLTSLTTPWRPGTSHFVFGDEEDLYFTWLCAVPKGRVEGTLTYDGRTVEVKGFGYHDHQWANIEHTYVWNHWLWARQDLGDYNILVFDFVTTREYGYKRFPLCFIEDKDGKIVFQSTNSVAYEVLDEYVQEETGKTYPKISKYIFENEGKRAEYIVTAGSEIEVMNVYGKAPPPLRERFDRANAKPSYARYAATGKLILNDGGRQISRSGNLIYEFAYLAESYRPDV